MSGNRIIIQYNHNIFLFLRKVSMPVAYEACITTVTLSESYQHHHSTRFIEVQSVAQSLSLPSVRQYSWNRHTSVNPAWIMISALVDLTADHAGYSLPSFGWIWSIWSFSVCYDPLCIHPKVFTWRPAVYLLCIYHHLRVSNNHKAQITTDTQFTLYRFQSLEDFNLWYVALTILQKCHIWQLLKSGMLVKDRAERYTSNLDEIRMPRLTSKARGRAAKDFHKQIIVRRCCNGRYRTSWQ